MNRMRSAGNCGRQRHQHYVHKPWRSYDKTTSAISRAPTLRSGLRTLAASLIASSCLLCNSLPGIRPSPMPLLADHEPIVQTMGQLAEVRRNTKHGHSAASSLPCISKEREDKAAQFKAPAWSNPRGHADSPPLVPFVLGSSPSALAHLPDLLPSTLANFPSLVRYPLADCPDLDPPTLADLPQSVPPLLSCRLLAPLPITPVAPTHPGFIPLPNAKLREPPQLPHARPKSNPRLNPLPILRASPPDPPCDRFPREDLPAGNRLGDLSP
ncbi:hypothetical protein BDK51DRAFT_44827 [Blyttiomyces helicus]|uniref:Uncharacterized protein n=1 Tax=Blyttiomyces helicus TaxID=388810 RepID=A0A4P9W9D1_9FUNG|nr:hypothetical protein BDK51DRAFT_44827 [Blyttiomyces helicus]|eukprot:RKO89004.1 hypothetical protein BDK51DRAFT_44827 [Blyttiomyces helicus]